MSQTIAKTFTIQGENFDGESVELEIPATSKKVTSSNNITSFNRPKTDPTKDNPRETRALNMNRIKVNIQVTAKVDDDFAASNHNGTGPRPDLANKEEWLDELWTLYLSNNLLALEAVNQNTYSQTSEWTGYIHNLDHTEKASTDNSVYDVTLKFVDEVQMNS